MRSHLLAMKFGIREAFKLTGNMIVIKTIRVVIMIFFGIKISFLLNILIKLFGI